MVKGKIKETKLCRRQRLIWLQNIKDWTGMTLEMMMNEIKNWNGEQLYASSKLRMQPRWMDGV